MISSLDKIRQELDCYFDPDLIENRLRIKKQLKEEKLKESFHIFPDNKDVLIAVELIKDLYPTKGMKYVQSIRSSIDKTMEYLDNAVIREGKDGNLADIRGMQKDAAKVLESLTLMEKNAEEEKNNFRTKAGRKTGLGEIL